MKNSLQKHTRKAIIISYYYPPIQQIGGVRITNFAQALQNLDYDIEIITSRGIGQIIDTSFTNRIPKEKIHCIVNTDIYLAHKIYRRVEQLFTGTSHEAELIEKTKSSTLGKSMLDILTYFPFNVLLHHGGPGFIIGSVIYGLKYGKDADLVITSFPPMVNHLIGIILKSFLPRTKWIADFRDLPGMDIKEQVDTGNEILCKLIGEKSDLLSTVSYGFANSLKKYKTNLKVIYNGFTNETYEKIKTEFTTTSTKTEKFKITYTGRLYGRLRTPELALQAVGELISENLINADDVEIIYAGPNGDIWNTFIDKSKLHHISTVLKNVPHSEAIELQRTSSINLMLTWAQPRIKGILTGKFQEYISALRPILCIINGQRDEEIEKIFSELNCGIVIYNDGHYLNDCKKFIYNKYIEWKHRGSVKANLNIEAISKLTYEHQLDEVLNALSLK